MINSENVTVTNIYQVLFINKNYPSNTITNYTSKTGLAFNELIFRLDGSVETHFDGEVIINNKNTIELLPKGMGKEEYWVKTLETGACIDVFFDTNVPLSTSGLCFNSKHYNDLRALFLEINKLWFRKELCYYTQTMSVLYKILSIIITSNSSHHKPPHHKKIEPAIHYINKNYCSPKLDYNYIAKMCNMSYSYLRRLFSECVGMSLTQYVISKRIEYAKDLLVSKHYSIGEIAELTGFSDVYYFSRIFKNVTGYSPKQFQNTTKNQTT